MIEMDRVNAVVRAFAAGEMVIVTDDDDRENEGDLILAAEMARPEQMAFIIRHTTGILCVPMPREEARRLRLNPMVADNDAPLGTAFTVSVDYKYDLTTGISAEERCTTVRALANPNAGADDFVRPGHIFPLIARDGGVLMRSGHTEAAVDIARLADKRPVCVIGELVNDDGTVKRGEQVREFAREHGLKLLCVADLIAYRQARERLVERVGDFHIDTPLGRGRCFSYVTPFDPVQHVAVIIGDISGGEAVPVRLHREAIMTDVFGDRAWLSQSYEIFKRHGCGVLVYLREGTAGVPQSNIVGSRVSEIESGGAPRAASGGGAPGVGGGGHTSAQRRDAYWREIGLGAQILRDLDVKSIRLLASREMHYVGLSGFGIEIAATDILDL